jgi:uncharacterized protein (TIGR03086 family)
MATRHGSAQVTLPSDHEILITRHFEAPRDIVWRALTEPAHLLRWWGPTWCPLVTCDVDFRVGGSWRYGSRMEDGTELGWHGVYRDIEHGRRVVTTEVFEGFPDAESVNTMTLDEVNGVTVLTTLVAHSSQANRDGHLQSGMEGGMQVTFDRLDDLLPVLDSTSERFRRISGAFTRVADGVGPDQWDLPAPCDGWVARDVVGHLVGWVPGFLEGSGVPLRSLDADVAADPAGAWRSLADALQAALDDPTVAGVEHDFGPPGRMSVESAIGMIVLGDVLIHTWDLARATGQDETLDPTLVAEMWVGMQPMDEMLRASGHYGPRVDVAESADVQTRLIGFTGRTP